jgi:hypothetical protein
MNPIIPDDKRLANKLLEWYFLYSKTETKKRMEVIMIARAATAWNTLSSILMLLFSKRPSKDTTAMIMEMIIQIIKE